MMRTKKLQLLSKKRGKGSSGGALCSWAEVLHCSEQCHQAPDNVLSLLRPHFSLVSVAHLSPFDPQVLS